MADDLEDAIHDAATEPLSAMVDGESATGRPIDDLIKADKYLAEKKAAKKGKTGLRYSRFIPRGIE